MKLHLLSLSIFIIMATACQKEQTDVITDDSNLSLTSFIMGEEPKDEKDKCFELVFPVDVDMPDATTITLTDESDWESVKSWYEAHPEEKEKPVLHYPLMVIFADGISKSIDDGEEMEALKKYCEGDDDKTCFELLYPLSYTLPDGTLVNLDNKEDWSLIKDWYETHPDVKEDVLLAYPVSIKFADGSTLIINNEEEMEAAKVDCE